MMRREDIGSRNSSGSVSGGAGNRKADHLHYHDRLLSDPLLCLAGPLPDTGAETPHRNRLEPGRALLQGFYLPQETGRLTRRVEVPAGQFLAGGYFSFSGSKTGVRRDPFDRSPEVPPGL